MTFRRVAAVLSLTLAVGLMVGSPLFGDAPSDVYYWGEGTATIDGVPGPGEWDGAALVTFAIDIPFPPGTSGAPITALVMNDSTNLYLAVSNPNVGWFFLGLFHFGSSSGDFCDPGADVLEAWTSAPTTLLDEHSENACADSVLDTVAGGTSDGSAHIISSGFGDFLEISHPLDSGDNPNDFSLSRGSVLRWVANGGLCTLDLTTCTFGHFNPAPFMGAIFLVGGIFGDGFESANFDGWVVGP